jgi:hypothetical protein
LISAFLFPGASSAILQPFTFAKAQWAKYKASKATGA